MLWSRTERLIITIYNSFIPALVRPTCQLVATRFFNFCAFGTWVILSRGLRLYLCSSKTNYFTNLAAIIMHVIKALCSCYSWFGRSGELEQCYWMSTYLLEALLPPTAAEIQGLILHPEDLLLLGFGECPDRQQHRLVGELLCPRPWHPAPMRELNTRPEHLYPPCRTPTRGYNDSHQQWTVYTAEVRQTPLQLHGQNRKIEENTNISL